MPPKLATKRHRERHTTFDLNRSSPQVREKYAKYIREGGVPLLMEGEIIDMSETINAVEKERVAGAIPKHPIRCKEARGGDKDELPQTVRDMVFESVEDLRKSLNSSISDIVTDNVNKQLTKVHESIAILNETLRSLALGKSSREEGNLPGQNVNARIRWNLDVPTTNHTSAQSVGNQANVMRQPFSSSGQNNAVPNAYFVNKARVERFGLKFDGSDTHLSVESFIFRLEYFQRQYQIPWREILDDFHLLVSGPASDWYWLYVETTPVNSWENLRHSLLNRFKTHRTNLEIMHELVERKQRLGESIDNYFYHLNVLRSKLETPISEFELIKLAKKNLRENIGRVVYPISVSSIEQLRAECVEAERHFSRRENREPMARKFIHEVEYEGGESDEVDLEEISATVTCWNCKKNGHFFIECPSTQRALFCYKCGNPDTITPNCPNCKNRGNKQRGVVSKGESRPSKITPKQ